MVPRCETRRESEAVKARLDGLELDARQRALLEHRAYIAGERDTDTDIGEKPDGRVPRPAGEHPRPPMSKPPSKPPMGKLAAYTRMLEKEMAAQDAQKTNACPADKPKVSKKEVVRIAKENKIAKEA
ncbi:M96 mating-specific protein [Phytophthora megakarya]|uniref:M96 mating-specific protein n=1 Tax=Phytophthora megakarya TaxID=4795 RepID=A0A225USL9_9STRA|nr:M96 mating-specific protein [Phytophthora megakarya]